MRLSLAIIFITQASPWQSFSVSHAFQSRWPMGCSVHRFEPSSTTGALSITLSPSLAQPTSALAIAWSPSLVSPLPLWLASPTASSPSVSESVPPVSCVLCCTGTVPLVHPVYYLSVSGCTTGASCLVLMYCAESVSGLFKAAGLIEVTHHGSNGRRR